MGSVELFVVLTIRAFHLSIMSRCVRSDQVVPDTQFGEPSFKHSLINITFTATNFFCKFCAVIRLYALDLKRKCFYQLIKKCR